jgi:sugar phosphate permease
MSVLGNFFGKEQNGAIFGFWSVCLNFGDISGLFILGYIIVDYYNQNINLPIFISSGYVFIMSIINMFCVKIDKKRKNKKRSKKINILSVLKVRNVLLYALIFAFL